MKIITTHHPEHTTFNGIVAALTSVEKDTMIWLPQYKPPYDMLDEMTPDFFFCTSGDLESNSILVNALIEYNIKTVVFGLQQTSLKPILLCVGDLSDDIYNNIDTPVIKILSFANIVHYCDGQLKEKYTSDIFHLSNEIKDFNISVLDHIIKQDWSVKICGLQSVPFPQYLGNIGVKNVTNLMVSSKITIDFDDKIIWDAAFNKTFCLSGVKNELFPCCGSVDDFNDQIIHFLADDKHRQVYIKKAYKKAKKNTCFHRLKDIGEKLGLTRLVDISLEKMEQLA